MDDMERLLMGLESRYAIDVYENEEKGGKDKKKKKRLPSITKVWKGGNNNSSTADNNNDNNDFGGGQSVRETSAIPPNTDAAKSTTKIINAMTPLDCLEERSRETDSHSTRRESLRFKDVGGSNGSKGSSQWSSSDEKDKIANATAAARHSMTMCSDKDKHRSNTSTGGGGVAASSSSSPPSLVSLEPTYEDLQRRYLQINTARREEYSVRVINALLDAWPKSVKTSSEGGRLPLHMACFGKATVGVMETILNAYPDAARQRNHDGFLPVHIAAHWGVSHPDIAPLLLRAYPDGAVGRNRWERTPIEEALGMAGENGREHQMSLVWSLRRHPTYWIHNDIGTMLLPRNVRVAPWRMVDVADDGGMSQKNDDNIITSRATVGGAVDVDDVGSSEEEDEGVEVQMKAAQSSAALNNDPSYIRKLAQCTDLSLLITKDKHWAAAALRCRSHPQEARDVMEVKVRGAYTAKITPLHYACENQPSVEVISTLIKANPAALERRQEPGGQLPLHAACTWGASPEVIQALLTALSSCAEMKDFLSNLPLHCACYSGADTKVIELLLSAYPQSVWPRNHQGSSAVDIVRRLSHRNRKETLHLLERTMSRLLVNAAAVEGEGVEVNDSCLEWV
jgi:hypothetical protein